MKKILLSTLLIVSLVLIGVGTSFAIQGQCVNCHTMHNSQNGTRMADRDTPYEQLLRAGCISCHTQNAGGQGSINTYTAPIVFHTTVPAGQGGGNTNAGGDFYWVATGYGATDSMGHNVVGIAGQDQSIGQGGPGFTPPGWDTNATPGALGDGQIHAGAGSWTQQLNCAGTYGCHGAHDQSGDFPGISGAHHGNTGVSATQAVAPTTVGASYRFLGGISGLENSEWNWNETSGVHNEYYGVDDPNNRDQTSILYQDDTTISYSCAQCHGFFHSRIDSSTTGTSPWLRHPSDIVLGRGIGTEYSDYNPDGGNSYSVEAPVGRGTVPATSSATVLPNDASGATGAIVLCVSCHRAHGSPEPDILRWTYAGMIAGSGTSDTGCFTCHTTKNAD